jgi:hypothetical protein
MEEKLERWSARLAELGYIVTSNVIADLGIMGGVGIAVGTAGGWVVGIVAQAARKPLTVSDAISYGAGAGAFCGVMIVVFSRTIY